MDTAADDTVTDGSRGAPDGPPDDSRTKRPPRDRWTRRPTLPDGARPYLPALALYGVTKLVGLAVFASLLEYAGDYKGKNPRFGGGAHWWDVLGTWDGWWYLQVAEHGYSPSLVRLGGDGLFTVQQNSVAFFPLYPALIRMVSETTGLGLYGSGILVSVVFSFVAAAGIFAVVRLVAGARAGTVAAGLLAVAPGAGVEWAVYSESLFVAIAAWACYAVMTKRWVAAGLLAFTAGLNRPTSAVLIGAVGLAALVTLARPASRREHGIRGPFYAMVVAPLGLLSYIAWVGYSTGEATAYFTLQREGWAHFFDYGAYTLDVLRNLAVGKGDYVFAFSYAGPALRPAGPGAALPHRPDAAQEAPAGPGRLHAGHDHHGPRHPADVRQHHALSAAGLPAAPRPGRGPGPAEAPEPGGLLHHGRARLRLVRALRHLRAGRAVEPPVRERRRAATHSG